MASYFALTIIDSSACICLGLTKENKTERQCKNRWPRKTKANVLRELEKLRNIVVWSHSEDNLRSLRILIDGAHCRVHRRNAQNRHRIWLEANSLAYTQDETKSVSVSVSSDVVDGAKHITTVTNNNSVQATWPSVEAGQKVESAVHLVTMALEEYLHIDQHGKPAESEKLVTVEGSQDIEILGITALNRKYSIRDQGHISTLMHKTLDQQDQEDGLVYVLRHKSVSGLFKIGWTKEDKAAKRQEQPGNCYAIDTEVIYESSSSFFAAQRAERLAQDVLTNHNLLVKECKVCGKGHREWFLTTQERVVNTVKTMERLVRLPAYKETDEGWKLTDKADKISNIFFNLDLAAWEAKLVPSRTEPQTKQVPVVLEKETDLSEINTHPDNHSNEFKLNENSQSLSGTSQVRVPGKSKSPGSVIGAVAAHAVNGGEKVVRKLFKSSAKASEGPEACKAPSRRMTVSSIEVQDKEFDGLVTDVLRTLLSDHEQKQFDSRRKKAWEFAASLVASSGNSLMAIGRDIREQYHQERDPGGSAVAQQRPGS